jgi:hypothetical protein
MMVSPKWRTGMFAATAAVVAVWLGAQIAQQEYFWAGTIGVALLLFLIARWQPRPLETLALAVLLSGYVIGNRGFAQLMISRNFPLLPAEAVLLLTGGLVLVRSASRHELPGRRDALNFVLLAWMILGSLRMVFDLRNYGIMALRDFATVYYAAFFYLGQEAGRQDRDRKVLIKVLLLSCVALLPLYALFVRFPDVFLGVLTFRGNPVIFYKGDLAGTFFAVGSVLLFLRFEQNHRWRNMVLSLISAGAVVATGSRASLLGLLVATAWLAIGGRWRFVVAQISAGIVASLLILVGALAMKISWEKTPLFTVYEQVVSIGDPLGQRAYRGEHSFFKGDNNLFRAVWWRAVVEETMEGNPYLGLGFGRDLADRFMREYYPEGSDEFSARSPHNILLTVFARMGAAGLILFLWFIALMGVHTWRAVHSGQVADALWCVPWVILTSACLGVVLEGPMGAVVFWTVLGLASARTLPPAIKIRFEPTADPRALPTAEALS